MLSIREKRRFFDSKPGGKGFCSSPPINNPAERGGTLQQAAINFCVMFSVGSYFFCTFGRSFRRVMVHFRSFRRVVIKIEQFRRVVIKIKSFRRVVHIYTRIRTKEKKKQEKKNFYKKPIDRVFIKCYNIGV